MRHFLLPGAIALLPGGVSKAASAARLVAARGLALRLPPGLLRAVLAAIDLPAIALAAQGNLQATARAQK
jgi:hypothetical protein